jgi:hypothetical protein
LVTHNPIILAISSSNLHVIRGQQKLAFSIPKFLKISLLGHREHFTLFVFFIGKYLHFQGRKVCGVFAAAIRGVNLG